MSPPADLVEWKASRKRQDEREKDKRVGPKPKDPPLSAEEKNAYAKMLKEAKANGATLANEGKGGLKPSLVLGAFRKGGWQCEICGTSGDEENGLTVHHRGGIPDTPQANKDGHANKVSNIRVLCEEDHDRVHTEARKEGTDSSQVTPAGDEGDPRRDKGKPPAKPVRNSDGM